MREESLTPAALAGAGNVVGAAVECLEKVDSTNTYLKKRAAEGAAHGLVVTAEEQTGGRGRRGRVFQCHRGKGLYLSALLRPRVPAEQVADVTAWTAVAVCRALEGLTGLKPGIKWPNDLLLGGKKLCGILCELVLDAGGNPAVVVGIGINVGQTAGDFDPEVAAIAASLAMFMEEPPGRTALARAVIAALDDMVSQFPEKRWEYLVEYRARCVTVGKEVAVISPAGTRRGRALAVDDAFRLVVEFENGAVEAVDSGEVSIRAKN